MKLRIVYEFLSSHATESDNGSGPLQRTWYTPKRDDMATRGHAYRGYDMLTDRVPRDSHGDEGRTKAKKRKKRESLTTIC